MVSLPAAVKPRLTCFRPSREKYCRIRQLPPLLKLWPSEIDDYSYPGTLRVVALLRKALRAERCRAREKHWAYDVNRHLGLMGALKEERARLDMLERGLPWRAGTEAGRRESRPTGTLRLPGSGDRAGALSAGPSCR
jgi:hypothetical protein